MALPGLLTLLTFILPVLLAILQSALEGFHAAHEIARLVRCPRHGVLLRGLADRACGVADLLLQRFEVGADVLFHPARVLRAGALQCALRVADFFADPLVADGARRLVELACGVLLVATHLVGNLFELLLEVADLRVHRVLALAEPLRLGLAARAGL